MYINVYYHILILPTSFFPHEFAYRISIQKGSLGFRNVSLHLGSTWLHWVCRLFLLSALLSLTQLAAASLTVLTSPPRSHGGCTQKKVCHPRSETGNTWEFPQSWGYPKRDGLYMLIHVYTGKSDL